MTTATYRFLDIGDPIQAGDEYFDPQTWKWMLISERRPGAAHERCTIRRLQAQPKLPTSPHFLVSQRLTEELAQARTNAEVTRLAKTAKQQEGEIKNLRIRVRAREDESWRHFQELQAIKKRVVELSFESETTQLDAVCKSFCADNAITRWRAPYVADQHRPFYKDEEGYELLREGDTPCPGDEYAQQAIGMTIFGPVAVAGLRWVPFNTNCTSFCYVVGREKGMTWRRPKPPLAAYRALQPNEIIGVWDQWYNDPMKSWYPVGIHCVGRKPSDFTVQFRTLSKV